MCRLSISPTHSCHLEDAAESEDYEDEEEEDEAFVYAPVMASEKKPAAKKVAAKTSTALSMSSLSLEDDEKLWIPIHSIHTYPAKNYDRCELIIDVPMTFTGARGSYKFYVDKDQKTAVLKVAIDEVFTDVS